MLVLMGGRKTPKPHDTETRAYNFIEQDLSEKGWDTRDPSRQAEGEVYTQNEVYGHEELAKYLDRGVPENVVKLSVEDFWVIEAKKTHGELDKALDEAIDYATDINKSKNIRALIATGVAGNQTDGYKTKSVFYNGRKWLPITMNGKEITGLLPKAVAQRILRESNPDLADVPIDKDLFLAKAEKINEILHLGAINKNNRAKVMASLLLSMLDDSPLVRTSAPSVLINDINSRAKRVLKKHGKENFASFIEIQLPPTEDNHIKYRNALVQTLQELDSLQILSAMNSGTDVLGEFYEKFLKYGNGAKEIGIVLTPRHVTRFAVEVLGVSHNDILYDPTAGTAGFLVAALDYIRQNSSPAHFKKFKDYHIFGIDQEPEVVALALVNMIFRGDGKTNIIEGNCFQKRLISVTVDGNSSAKFVKEEGVKKKQKKYEETETEKEESEQQVKAPITKVLMNPPFALKTSDEQEYRFIDHALKQMDDEGVLFSVLPSSVMIKAGQVLTWRKNLLENNTLLSVMTFPGDLFYPVGVATIGIFIKKGIPHPKSQNVLWIRAVHDGLLKKKGIRLENPKEPNDFKTVRDDLRSFIINQKTKIENIPEFQKACPIDFNDKALELVPEEYLDSKQPDIHTIEEGMETLVRQTVAYIIKSRREEYLGELRIVKTDKSILMDKVALVQTRLDALFEIRRGRGEYRETLQAGKTPLVSATSQDNGILDYVDIVPTFRAPAITVERVSGGAFVQIEDFATVPADISVLVPRTNLPLSFLFYVTALINDEKWRYSYGRKLTASRLDRMVISIPSSHEGKFDYDFIESLLKRFYGWNGIENALGRLLKERPSLSLESYH